MKYILSYGGGINSSALFFYLIENKMHLDHVIFSDTGEETKDTYDAVKRLEQECIRYEILFTIVRSKHGNLYDYYFRNKVVMSMMKRDCTSKFKISPLRKYLRDFYGKKMRFTTYIGIAWDEQMRRKPSNVQYITNSFPLCDAQITRYDCLSILKKYSFQAQKSGCKGCIFLKKRDWIVMLREDPNEFKRHMMLEINNRRYPEMGLNPRYRLTDLYYAWINQEDLKKFIDTKETCSSVSGGCFL